MLDERQLSGEDLAEIWSPEYADLDGINLHAWERERLKGIKR